MEHEARSPARFSSLLSVEPHNQKPSAVRFAHGETKVPNLFQDLTLFGQSKIAHLRFALGIEQDVSGFDVTVKNGALVRG